MTRTPFRTPLETLPRRLLVVAAVFLLALAVNALWARAGEAAFVVPALCLSGISILLAWRAVIFTLNALTGLALFVPFGEHKQPHPLVLAVNRQLGHFEAIFSWLTVALVWSPNLVVEATAVATLFAVGPLIINALGVYTSRRELHSEAQLHVARRKYFYVATALGLLVLALLDRPQAATLLPLDAAILVGVLVRAVYFGFRTTIDDAPPLKSNLLFWDRALVAVSLAIACAVPYLEVRESLAAHREDYARRWAAPRRSCDERSKDFSPEASLFLVSDNQFHALDGKRSGLQLDMVDAVVPVAARPVELDLLSGVTLDHFADVFHELSRTRPGMLWAHLGDIGDVGCTAEQTRFDTVLDRFGRDSLAALAPGNHDSTFLGCFDWHPQWSKACPGGRASKPDQGFSAHVVKLGDLRANGEITGLFLDTTDYAALSIGIAGSQGAISKGQADWVMEHVPNGGGPVVIFMHHTHAELSFLGKLQFRRLTRHLGDRLLAIVSAHEHLAANRKTVVGGRTIDELVVGSTIDPLQEATLIDFRTGRNGPEMRVQSIPAVPPEKLACAGQPPLEGPPPHWPTLESCVATFGKLTPACSAFLHPAVTPARPQDPDALAAAQNARAKQLLACLEVGNGAERPLDDPAVFATVAGTRYPGLALCISSAASLVQGSKTAENKLDLAGAVEAMARPGDLLGSRSIVVGTSGFSEPLLPVTNTTPVGP
jgi:hypothetical protein